MTGVARIFRFYLKTKGCPEITFALLPSQGLERIDQAIIPEGEHNGEEIEGYRFYEISRSPFYPPS